MRASAGACAAVQVGAREGGGRTATRTALQKPESFVAAVVVVAAVCPPPSPPCTVAVVVAPATAAAGERATTATFPRCGQMWRASSTTTQSQRVQEARLWTPRRTLARASTPTQHATAHGSLCVFAFSRRSDGLKIAQRPGGRRIVIRFKGSLSRPRLARSLARSPACLLARTQASTSERRQAAGTSPRTRPRLSQGSKAPNLTV